MTSGAAIKTYEKIESLENSAWKKEGEILEYLSLVRYIAGRIAINLPPHISQDDLEQEGIIGLLEAFSRRKEENGGFRAYAAARIRGRIIDWLRSQDWAPRSVRAKAREIEQINARLEQELGRTPKGQEVAKALGVKLEIYHHILLEIAATSILSLEDMASFAEDLSDKEEQQILQAITEVIKGLPEKEKLILSLYYQEDLTLKEIAQILELSESTICRHHSQAMRMIKEKIVAI